MSKLLEIFFAAKSSGVSFPPVLLILLSLRWLCWQTIGHLELLTLETLIIRLFNVLQGCYCSFKEIVFDISRKTKKTLLLHAF